MIWDESLVGTCGSDYCFDVNALQEMNAVGLGCFYIGSINNETQPNIALGPKAKRN